VQILDQRTLDSANLAGCERLFVETWYGLTHVRSLDSFRARCLNARTIVKEIHDELEIGRIKDDQLDALLREATFLLERDVVITSEFGAPLKCLQIHFDKKEKDRNKRTLTIDIADAYQVLRKGFLTKLCEHLQSAVSAGNADHVEQLTGSLVSDLIDRGWSLETLFGWHGHFLKQAHRGFSNNLSFMLKQLQQKKQPFRIVLRIAGSSKARQLDDHGSFAISETAPITPQGQKESAYCSTNVNQCFATCTIKSFYHDDAALEARNKLESLLDLLQFEYEQSTVSIDEECLVERLDDKKRQFVRIRTQIPNPLESLQEGDFQAFVRRRNTLASSSRIDKSTKRLILASIRQYRFGRDSTSLSDKFINWWMGLEALCHANGDIGNTVSRRAGNCILYGYLFRICRDLLISIKHYKPNWNTSFASEGNSEHLPGLSVGGLIKLLQSSQGQALCDCLRGNLLLERHANRVRHWLTDAKACSQQLEGHLSRVQWHLHRLYRIRCCIVHGAPVRFKLTLAAANLEYYLKQTILLTMDALDNHKHVNGLDDVYERAELSNNRILDALKVKTADHQTIRNSVFSDLVTR
jgi:hypothetical protein